MLPTITRLFVIALLYQCIQGEKEVIRRLNFNSEPHEKWLKKDNIAISDDLYEKLSSRMRKNADNDPMAHSFTLMGDRRQFGRVRYAGEGSSVRLLHVFY